MLADLLKEGREHEPDAPFGDTSIGDCVEHCQRHIHVSPRGWHTAELADMFAYEAALHCCGTVSDARLTVAWTYIWAVMCAGL